MKKIGIDFKFVDCKKCGEEQVTEDMCVEELTCPTCCVMIGTRLEVI